MTDSTPQGLPTGFEDEASLEEFMTRPSPELVGDLSDIDGDIMLLGVAGKMGLTMARMAKRACPDKRVIGVARFSDPKARESLERAGVEAVTCDLLDRDQLHALEDCPNILFLAGMKFGTEGNQAMTWAMNSLVPAMVAERFRDSRIVAFSTACVYAMEDFRKGGSLEGDPLTPPGEYANSCVGRERMFQFFSSRHGTPGRLVRLSYAIDMRYGVLHDLATAIAAGKPIPIDTNHVNVIWQGDANEIALRLLAQTTTPTLPVNVSGPEIAEVREMALKLGALMGREPTFTGSAESDVWLVNTDLQQEMFGAPRVPLEAMIRWTADWVGNGRASLGKPTHFEGRDGTY